MWSKEWGLGLLDLGLGRRHTYLGLLMDGEENLMWSSCVVNGEVCL